MKRAGWIVVMTICVSGARAQSPDRAILDVQEALHVAGGHGDKASYGRLVADDLRWVDPAEAVLNKAQRLAQVIGSSVVSDRAYSEVSINVYGDVAVEVAKSTRTRDGRVETERLIRVFTRHGSDWLLSAHCATQMP